MMNFMRIRSICHLLDAHTTASLCFSLCLAHIDYCNSILYGLPDISINKMQKVQNMCVHLVLRRLKWDSTKACLRELHWLPICQRIIHKILTLTYKCRNQCRLQYLRDLLSSKQPSRQGLWSCGKSVDLLVIPGTKHKTFADRSFSVAAPTLWNSLPDNIQNFQDRA